MAKKYWWEEDDQQEKEPQGNVQVGTQESKTQGYWWQENDQQSKTQQTNGKSYWWDNGSISNTVGTNIVNSVNSWLDSHNSYVKSYQDRYANRKGNYEDAYVSDSADWYDSVRKQKGHSDMEAAKILAYMDQYADYLDADWMKEVRNTLTQAQQGQSKILSIASNDNKHWSNFTPNEDQIAAGYTAEKIYNEWQAEQKQYAADMAFDAIGGMVELENLKKDRDAYLADQAEKRKQAQSEESFLGSVGRWLGTTPDTSIPFGGASSYAAAGSYDKTISNATPYDKQIADLEAQIERSKYVQGYEGYMGNMDAGDYSTDSKYASTRTDVAMDDAMYYVSYGGATAEGGVSMSQMYDKNKLFGDFLYDYINRNEDALAVATVNDTSDYSYFLGFSKDFLETMKDEEIGVYNYLYKDRGPEAANEFLSFIQSDLKGRKRMQEQAYWANYAKEDPFGSSVFSILVSPMKGFSYLAQAADMLDDGKMEQNAGYNRFSYIPSTIRSQVSTTIENSGAWGKVGSFAYNTGMSMGDFLFTTAIGGGNQALTLGIMGTGAAADATLAAKDRGLDDDQAFTLGTIAGMAEIAMERISLGAWLDGDMSEGALRYLLKNAFSEGGEEAGTSVINLMADVIIAGDKSEWNVAMQAYMEQGKSEAEAFGLVLAENAAQIGLDALGGVLSGAAIGGGTYAGTSTVSAFQYGDTAKNKDKTQNLVAEGLELNPDNQYIQKMQGKIDKGKNLTGMQIRNILAANQEQIKAKDIEKIKSAAAQRLTNLGETKEVATIAELATKRALGQRLTPSEKSKLARSQYGARVANELLPENIDSGEYTTDWAEDIGTEIVNYKAYNKTAREIANKIAESLLYKPLEKRMEGEKPANVSDTGKAVIRATGEEIDLTNPKIKSITKDDVVLNVNGKDVDTKEIDFATDEQWYAFNAIKKIEHITPGVANSMIANLDMTKPIGPQLNGMDEAFSYGIYKYSEADLKAGLFAGELTDELRNEMYNLGRYVAKNTVADNKAAIKKMRTAADEIAEKAAAEGKEVPKSKDLTITYNHGGGVVEKLDTAEKKLRKEMSKEQRGGVEVAKLLHMMGIGTDFELFASKTVTDEDGNSVEVYVDDEGQEQAAYAGVYLAADGKIRINLNAYSGTNGLVLNALAHELTHFIKSWSPEKYVTMAEFLTDTYGETGMNMHQRVLREQARLKGIRGKDVSYEEAYDEVVANALNRMFDDGKVLERLNELAAKDRGLVEKILAGIKQFLKKFFNVYQKNQSLFRDTRDLMEMKEAFEKLQEMFADALVDASANFQASRIVGEALGENAKVETNAQGELLLAANESGNVQVYSEQTYMNGGRDKLEMALRQNGHTDEEITQTLSYVDDALDYIKILAAGYAKEMGYTNLSNHLIADIVTNVKTGKQVMSAIVNNGDYPVNIDLSLICKKRVAYMNLMSRLIRDGVFDKVNYDGAAIAEVNEILRENGFETACLGCFVESRRLQFQTWAETIVSEWNAEVEKRNPNADSFGFAKGKMEELTDADIDALTRELESVKKNDQGNVNLGHGNSVTRMGRLLDALPSLQKKLTVEDLLTPEGLTALRKHDGSLFSIVKSRYGAASPKIVQDFNPYASEIAMLTFAQVKGITNNAVKGAQAYVEAVKKEYVKPQKVKGESKSNFDQRKKAYDQRVQDEAMRRYLYDIGGARIQSFSDFMIENIFDYIQIFADLAAKRLPLHGYTKEIVCLRLFGMTGAKWNGSLIAHVERNMGKEYAGLLPAGTKDGIRVSVNGTDYVIGFDDYARNAATGGKSFIQSIGMKDIIALQLDPRYSPYVGNITIGVSDAQILAMLDSPLFRMVIPYHASGMLPMFAKLVGVDMYNDYTDYQNTTVRQYYDLDGKMVSELKNAKGETVKADTSYAFNAEIQKTKDAKIAANNYLKWCAQRHPVYDGSNLVGYATFNPKFSNSPYGNDFTRHENYYKLLEDFNTYDCVTEASTVQGAVTMNFPTEENRLTEQQMAEYKNALRETGIFTEKDIEKYAKKADMTFKEIINAEVGNRANYAATQAPKWESTVKAVEAKLQKDYARQYSSQQTDADKKITLAMTDSERTEILQTKAIIAEAYDGKADALIDQEKEWLESGQLGLVESALAKIAEEFHVFTGYNIKDVGVSIEFSRSNLSETVSKKITPKAIAKLLPVLKTAVENAIGIEAHANRYFYDTDIVRFDNLVGGYVDGENFVPVRFGLKHRRKGEAILYVIVDQQKIPLNEIKAEVVEIAGTQNVGPEVSRSAFKVNISDLVPFVNGGDLLRYVPDNMLTESQKQTKWDAVAKTIVKTNKKNDAKYAKYIREGKIRVAGQMVVNAAKDAGYTTKGYHGSRTPGFTVVDKYSWLWLARNEAVASGYGTHDGVDSNRKPHNEKGVYTMLYNLGNNLEVYADGASWGELPVTQDEYPGVFADEETGAITTNAMAEWAARNGYDSITFVDVDDGGLTTVDVVFNPNRDAKSADPITYDDNGNVIPISKRFDKTNNDIRYSSQQTDIDSNGKQLGDDQLEYFEKSMARNRKGNLQVVYHGGTVEFEFDTSRGGNGATQYGPGAYFTDSEYYAKEYTWYRGGNVKAYYLKIEKLFDDTNMDATVKMPQWKKLEQILRTNGIEDKFINGFANNGFAYMSRYLGNKAGSTRSDSWGGSEILNGMLREAGFDGIKGTLNDMYQYVIFTPNQAKLTTNEVPSTFYDTRYSTQQTDNLTDRDMLANAFETISKNSEEYEMIQDYKSNVKLLNKLERDLDEVKQEIWDIRFGTGKYDAERLKLLEGKADRLAKDITRYDKRLLNMEASAPLRKVIQQERKKAEQKTKAHVNEIQQNKKARAEQAEYRHKIKNFKKKLEGKLLRPTDRQYVPVDLINAMIDVCEIIDTDTDLYKADGSINKAQIKRNETKEKLQNLKEAYENLKTNSDPLYAGEFDEMVYTYLKELKEKFSDKSLNEMSLDELSEMYEILISIDETLADARKLIGWGDAETVYEAGDAIVAEQNTITKKRKNGKRNAAQKGFDKVDNLSLSPVRNVERMSAYNQDSALLKLFKKFEQGIRKKNKFKMDAYKKFEELTTGKEYDDAIYKEVGGKKYTDIKGRKFGISKMQMMQAILSWEREQANKNMHHIENGGFTFADLDKLRKGNLKDAVSAENSHRVPAAYGMVAEFNQILKDDKWCQDYMKAAREFFNGIAKDAVNETSIALKHRIIAKDKNYIPFEVDTNFVNTEITDMDAVQKTINSYGTLKETTDNAPQPLYITGLNNILDRHIEQVGNIYGLAIEVRNFNKVWNVRSKDELGNNPTVKETIDTNWGKEGVKNIEQAVKDIQGPRVRERNALYDAIKSGYIGSTFLLNLSVVTKQIGSLYSSISMLKWRDPARMIGNLVYTMANSKKISSEVDKYTATAWMRRQGMSDAEVYTLMTQAKKPGLLRTLKKAPAVFNPTKWITAMDHAVALSLWKYAKEDTAKRTGLEGEELLKATAEFYDEVVENTQSMTDVLHRPEIQKRGDVISESFAMFKTDLYQMAGQLQATAGRYTANKSKENGKALVRTVYSIAMSAIWGSLMTTVFALLQYKVKPYADDEDDELTVESWLNRQGIGLAGDFMGYIFPLFGSEIVGVFENIMHGESDDIVDSLALTAINDLYNAMITVGTSIKDGELPELSEMRKLAAKALQVFGIPANNILRTLDAIQLHAEDIANGEFFSFNAGLDSKTEKLYSAIIRGDTDDLKKLKSTYKTDDAYHTAVRKVLRENDPRIHAAAQARYEGRTEEYKRIFREIKDEGKFNFDDIMSAINSEETKIRTGVEPDKATSSYSASSFVEAIVAGNRSDANAMKSDIISVHMANGKTKEEAEKEFTSAVGSAIGDAYSAGLLSDVEAKKMLQEYAGKDEEEAASRVNWWVFCEKYPKYKDVFTESHVEKYNDFGKPAGISVDVYAKFITGTKGLGTIRDEWDEIVKSKREQVLEVIDSLPLTWQQKDALYLAAGYSESKIWDVPW